MSGRPLPGTAAKYPAMSASTFSDYGKEKSVRIPTMQAGSNAPYVTMTSGSFSGAGLASPTPMSRLQQRSSIPTMMYSGPLSNKVRSSQALALSHASRQQIERTQMHSARASVMMNAASAGIQSDL